MISIRFPLKLDKQMGPNGRMHHMKKYRIKKAAKIQAGWEAVALRSDGVVPALPCHYTVTVGMTKHQINSKWDDDNVRGNELLKALRDGLAEAFHGDDHEWVCDDVLVVEDPANIGYIQFYLGD